MHMHRDPQFMQVEPLVGDAIEPVRQFLAARIQVLRQRGVNAQRIVLDPGIGFGKTVAQNFSLLTHQSDLLSLGYPVLAGWSRKSSLGQVTGTTDSPSQDRLAASVAAAVLAVDRGARLVRVHDVQATVHALKVWQAVASQSPTGQTPSTD
jgi:dihydropteroate synthase